jgi:ABC-type branched-subunit amino acid transport system ATPase component
MDDRRGLDVDDLSVRFGGVLAVDELSLRAPAGQITSLIGPNGAGKTTTFNACTGLVRPTSGRVQIDGTDVTGTTPQRRAQLGLGRTFQRMELFDSLTVRENVSLGREARLSGDRPWAHLVCSRRDAALIDQSTEAALALCGIEALTDRPVRGLSTGQRRLVELARAAAGGFSMLLLDEPSSG